MEDLDNFIEKFAGYGEEFVFYNDTVKILYDKVEHTSKLVKDGELIDVPHVTTILHKTLDKSQILIPWGCSEMGKKLISLIPSFPFTTSQDYLEKLLHIAKKAHKDKLKDAGNVGTMAHDWIEQYIKHTLNNNLYDPELLKMPGEERAYSCCTAALMWMSKHNVRWLFTERKIYSRIHNYTGTLDGLAITDSCNNPLCCPKQFKDRRSLIDWKTSNDLRLEYLIQASAYWGAFIEQESVENPHGPLIEDGWVIKLGKEDGDFETWHIWDIDEFEVYYYGFLNARKWYTSLEYAESQMKHKNDTLRFARKEQRQKEKLEQLKIKCKGADKYKGVRYPVCNGGTPCESCVSKWSSLHPDLS